MKKVFLLFHLFFFNIFLVAMDQQLPVCLMLGYDRDTFYLEHFPKFIKKLWRTYKDGKTACNSTVQGMQLITVDSRCTCVSKNLKHIQVHPADADFSTYSINLKEIFIQMSSIHRDVETQDLGCLIRYYFDEKDYISRYLGNPSLNIKTGVKITIEWFAHLAIVDSEDSVFNDENKGLENPFLCAISKQEIISLLKNVLEYKKKPLPIYMEQYKQDAQKYIQLYAEKHVLCSNNEVYLCIPGCTFKSALKRVNNRLEEELEELQKTTQAKVPTMDIIRDIIIKEKKYYAPRDLISFFLIQDIFMSRFHKNVRTRLEALGFTDISFRRGTNELNGHENAHLITAIKK